MHAPDPTAPASPPLIEQFIARARARRSAPQVFDPLRGESSRLRTLTGGVLLARTLRAAWDGQERVGVLLPPSLGGVLANLAAALAGRTVVNLNYTMGAAGMAAAVRQAGLRTVVTARAFTAKAQIEPPAGVEPIWLDDLLPKISKVARLRALAAAALLPVRMLRRSCGAPARPDPERPITILFSSGSTGEPKGVPLTDANVAANVAAAAHVLPFTEDDRFLAILPLFHAFGYMLSWFGLTRGLALVTFPNPRDAEGIAGVVRECRASIVVATPTFLQLWLRRTAPADLASVRWVITGAERLPPRVADAFEKRFGVRPMEGYGATECAPVIAVSTPGVPERSVPVGVRDGTVGRPLPGVQVRVVDPDAMTDLPTGERGMILVRGPNVMRGYLGRDDLSAQAFHDGYYVTGDLGCLDAEGMLSIGDRLARFAKLGGEMVPHARVEEALLRALGAEEQVLAVTSVACPRKGEQLVVLHTVDGLEPEPLLRALRDEGLPNLWLPEARRFFRVAEMPLLGTGKLDLKGLREMAQRQVG